MLIFILAVGVFGILNTEMGVIGILPLIAYYYDVSVSKAGLFVNIAEFIKITVWFITGVRK